MAAFDQGGGCACGLHRICNCSQEQSKKRTFTSPEKKRYLLVRNGSPHMILNGQDELIESFNMDPNSPEDQYYELGPEVELKVSVSVKSKVTVYRDGDVR